MAQPYYGFTTTTTLDDTALMLWRNLGENKNISFSAFKSLLFTGPTITGNLNFTGTGNRITGDFSNATIANRVMFQTNVANSNTLMGAIPSGTGTVASFRVFNSSDSNNSGVLNTVIGPSIASIISTRSGTGTTLPLTLGIGDSAVNNVLLNTNGNFLVKTAVAQVDDDNSAKLQVTGGIKSDTLKLTGLPVYADNTSALAGGLVAGNTYRTSTGVMMVVF